VYRITKDGERALAEWVADLRRTRQEIDHLLAAYEQVSQPEEAAADEDLSYR
jgi:DNA-binding PadR family transcriptional regulator